MATKQVVKKSATKKLAAAAPQYDGIPFAPDIGTVFHTAKAGRDVLVVRVSEFKGRKSLDLRRFYAKEQGEHGEELIWAPGKGLSVPAPLVSNVLTTLTKHASAILKALDGGK